MPSPMPRLTPAAPSSIRLNDSAPTSDRKPKSNIALKKWRVSTRQGWSGTSRSADRVEDLPRERPVVLLLRHSDECLLERSRSRPFEGVHTAFDGHATRRQDDDARAQLLDHVEAVRAEEDHA